MWMSPHSLSSIVATIISWADEARGGGGGHRYGDPPHNMTDVLHLVNPSGCGWTCRRRDGARVREISRRFPQTSPQTCPQQPGLVGICSTPPLPMRLRLETGNLSPPAGVEDWSGRGVSSTGDSAHTAHSTAVGGRGPSHATDGLASIRRARRHRPVISSHR
jgi:hypothetical protein